MLRCGAGEAPPPRAAAGMSAWRELHKGILPDFAAQSVPGRIRVRHQQHMGQSWQPLRQKSPSPPRRTQGEGPSSSDTRMLPPAAHAHKHCSDNRLASPTLKARKTHPQMQTYAATCPKQGHAGGMLPCVLSRGIAQAAHRWAAADTVQRRQRRAEAAECALSQLQGPGAAAVRCWKKGCHAVLLWPDAASGPPRLPSGS